jgi:hypothetical protein
MQSAPRYTLGQTCKENPGRERVPKGGQAPSPSARKSTLEISKPPSPEDTVDPTGAKGVLTSPFDASLGHDAAHQFPRLEPTEYPEVSP